MHVSTSLGYVIAFFVGLGITEIARRKPTKISRLGEIFEIGLTHQVTRFAFVFIWWWLGWHFLGSLQPI